MTKNMKKLKGFLIPRTSFVDAVSLALEDSVKGEPTMNLLPEEIRNSDYVNGFYVRSEGMNYVMSQNENDKFDILSGEMKIEGPYEGLPVEFQTPAVRKGRKLRAYNVTPIVE